MKIPGSLFSSISIQEERLIVALLTNQELVLRANDACGGVKSCLGHLDH